ncbi:hypothetical protein JYT28_01705, partial [Desulfobulbus sp. AH-315-M07]|nr:hypothetical protein [Desulfobulbus sp. AH-315-M07]
NIEATGLTVTGPSTLFGLSPTSFLEDTISQWTNDVGYLLSTSTLNGLIRSTEPGDSYLMGGNFGVGTMNPAAKLDVMGGIKLGYEATCSAANGGTLRYSAGNVEFCNGSAWKTMGRETPIIWTGYCPSHGTAGGWNTYCNSGVRFTTAAGYISANGSGTFTFGQPGYYMINFAWLKYGSAGGSGHSRFLKNGGQFFYSHDTNAMTSRWFHEDVQLVWPFNAGDTLVIYAHNPGNYAYHAGPTHSGVQITYQGPL